MCSTPSQNFPNVGRVLEYFSFGCAVEELLPLFWVAFIHSCVCFLHGSFSMSLLCFWIAYLSLCVCVSEVMVVNVGEEKWG